MLEVHTAPDASARVPVLQTIPAVPAAPRSQPSAHDALFAAAGTLLPVLEAGRPLDATTLRNVMTRAFGASDAEGAWVWKDAYEAAEGATVLFIRRHARAMRRHAGAGLDGPFAMLKMLNAVAALEPSHTKRSEEQVRMQQFSTPLPLAYAALRATAIRAGRCRAGAVRRHRHAGGDGGMRAREPAAGNLHLNEIADVRRALLCRLFPGALVTGVNAENAADHLARIRPTAVIMNPPFSATPGVDRIRHDADLRHMRSAFSMLPPGGRLTPLPRPTAFRAVPTERRLRPPRSTRPRRVHHGHRRPCLRAPGHRFRHQAHRARPDRSTGHRRRSPTPVPRLPGSCSTPSSPGFRPACRWKSAPPRPHPAVISSATRPRRARRSQRPRMCPRRPHPGRPMTGDPCPN